MADKYVGEAAIQEVFRKTKAALSQKEDSGNKVTAISASSTHSQYPSAKAVHDAISAEIGGDSNVFIATYTYDGSEVSCNKTYSEIKAALNAGKLVSARLVYDTTELAGVISIGVYSGISNMDSLPCVAWRIASTEDAYVGEYEYETALGDTMYDMIHHYEDDTIRYGYVSSPSIVRLYLQNGGLSYANGIFIDDIYFIRGALLFKGTVEIEYLDGDEINVYTLRGYNSTTDDMTILYGFAIREGNAEGSFEIRYIAITATGTYDEYHQNYVVSMGTASDLSKLDDIGNLSNLVTDVKTNVVSAVNEVKIETTALETTVSSKADADDLDSLETVVNGKESLSNKVVSTTGISGSSTDTQYPSAKAVNDFVEGKNYITADDITIDSTPTSGSTNAVQSGGTYNFVNSSIATNTAYFRGTYNSVAELNAYSGIKTNNDYAFVIVYDETVTTQVKEYKRYKYDGSAWDYEYTLNNSSFTSDQWSAINSLITATKVTGYDSHLSSTSNPHSVTKVQVGLGNVDNTADIDKPVSTDTSIAIANAVSNRPTTSEMNAAIAAAIGGAINGSY